MSIFGSVLLSVLLFSSVSISYAESISVPVQDTSYDILYTAEGLTIESIETNFDDIGILITVETIHDANSLEITLPRAFLDSIISDEDADFIILADGDWVDYTETQTSDSSRTLTFFLPSGTEEIEIFGTILSGVSFDLPEETIVEETQTVIELPSTLPGESVEESVEEPVEVPVETIPEETITITPEVTQQSEKCGPGTILQDGACVLDERCGPGTILQDGACVLDERCGPGTILQDGVCVLSEEPASESMITVDTSDGMDLTISAIVAFGIAFAIMIALAIVAKAHTRKN